MPVTVATLPIGSTAAGCASVGGAGEADGVGEGAGDGCASGCACASSIASDANATLAPAAGNASSTSANMKRRQATINVTKSPGEETRGEIDRYQPSTIERRMNVYRTGRVNVQTQLFPLMVRSA